MAADNTYPTPKFFFRVKFGNTKMSFQEVSGLEQQVELLEYRHGKSPLLMTQKRAGLGKASTITLKRGVFQDRDELVDLFAEVLSDKAFYPESGSKLEMEISLLDDGAGRDAKPIVVWTVANAVPIKFSGTDLKSDASEIAIESIEFAHEGIRVEMS